MNLAFAQTCQLPTKILYPKSACHQPTFIAKIQQSSGEKKKGIGWISKVTMKQAIKKESPKRNIERWESFCINVIRNLTFIFPNMQTDVLCSCFSSNVAKYNF